MADLAGAAHHAGERAEQPVGQRAGEDHVGILERRRQDRAAAAQQAVDAGPAEQEHGAEQGRRRRRRSPGHGKTSAPRPRVRPAPIARAIEAAMAPPMAMLAICCISISNGNTSARPARRVEPEVADEMRVDAGRHRDQHDVHHEVRRREAQQRRHDRPFEQQARARRGRRRLVSRSCRSWRPQPILGGQLWVSPVRLRHQA